MKKHPLLAGAFPVLKKREVEKRVPITQTLQNRCDLDALIIGAGFERGVSHLKIKDDQFVKHAPTKHDSIPPPSLFPYGERGRISFAERVLRFFGNGFIIKEE